MKIFVVGLNHRSAPLAVLEKLAFDPEQTLRALRELRKRFEESEFVLLSTCNRVGLDCAYNRMDPVVLDDLMKFLSEYHHLPWEEFQEYLYTHSDEDAVRHLLKVASSLDSLVVGEPQIIGQVKESYRLSWSTRRTRKTLNRAVDRAFC